MNDRRVAAPNFMLTHPDDDVFVVLQPTAKGFEFPGGVLAMRDFVLGQKVARHHIDEGAPVRRYGAPIGRACRSIEAGELVHDHNLRSDYQPGVTRRSPSEGDQQ